LYTSVFHAADFTSCQELRIVGFQAKKSIYRQWLHLSSMEAHE